MKNILFISLLLITSWFTSCGCDKATAKEKGMTAKQKEIATIQKTYPEVPQCVLDKIIIFQEEAKANPPRTVYQYQYNGRIVYYITAPCCDIYPQLFDENCNLLCAPDGGFTGRGDGKCIDFNKIKTAKKLIWQDKRD